MSGTFNLRLSEEDIIFFEDHGWWLSDRVISDSQLADLEYAFARYEAGEIDRDLVEPILPHWSQTEGSNVKQADYLSLKLDGVFNFVNDPMLPGIAAQLARTDSIRLFHDQLICKLPASEERPHTSVGWHTDRAYWKTCTSEKMLTAWIPMHDVSLEQGPLAVWDQSHKWPGGKALHSFDDSDHERQEAIALADGYQPEVRVLEMKRGQVSFHHCRLVHGSYSNTSSKPRLGFAVHYQDHDNQRVSNGGTVASDAFHLNDVLCRTDPLGIPDYGDPEVCPTLWPPATP